MQQPWLVTRDDLILHRDNEDLHNSRFNVQKWHSLGYEILEHQPYFPDISPADYHLFEHIGFSMRKERFRYSEEVVDAFEQIIKAKDELFF